MNEYNKTLQREIRSYEEAIDDMKRVLELLDDADGPKNITLYIDERAVVLGKFGISALKTAINGRIVHYESAIRNARRQMI